MITTSLLNLSETRAYVCNNCCAMFLDSHTTKVKSLSRCPVCNYETIIQKHENIMRPWYIIKTIASYDGIIKKTI